MEFCKILLIFRTVYSICQPVLEKILKAAEVTPEKFRAILERDLETGHELWEIWQQIPRNSKKVCQIFCTNQKLTILLHQVLTYIGNFLMFNFLQKKKKIPKSFVEGPWYHKGDGPYDVDTPGCYFYRLPRV